MKTSSGKTNLDCTGRLGIYVCHFLKILAVLKGMHPTALWLISLSFAGHNICTCLSFLSLYFHVFISFVCKIPQYSFGCDINI
jgi:hypothetical protein